MPTPNPALPHPSECPQCHGQKAPPGKYCGTCGNGLSAVTATLTLDVDAYAAFALHSYFSAPYGQA